MKHVLLAAVVLSLAACSSTDENAPPEYQRLRTVVGTPDVYVEPDGEHLQYMAYSLAEERALSGWLDSRSEAASKVSAYESEHPGRNCTILWRQNPSQKVPMKYPKG